MTHSQIERGAVRRRRSVAPDVMALMEGWVQRLEGGHAVTEGDPGDRPLEEGATQNPVATTPTTDRPVPPDVRIEGLLVSFSDPTGGSVALTRSGPHFQHQGTVAPRGAKAPPAKAYAAAGLEKPLANAFEFVVAWHGSPFDAVNVRSGAEGALSWGFWDLDGPALAESLGAWKGRDPESFSALLQKVGIDVKAPADGNGEPPALSSVECVGVPPGSSAESVISATPHLLAALARAGRQRNAQLAQIETTARRFVEPALALAVSEGGRPVRELAQSPRELAGLLILVRLLGLRGAARLVRQTGDPPSGQEPDHPWLRACIQSLQRAGRPAEAFGLLRALSTPELES